MRLPTRLTASFAATALALSVGLVSAGPATADTNADAIAHPASSATFDSLSISGLKKKIKLPNYNKRRTVSFTVNIAGSPSDGGIQDLNGDGLAIDYKAYDVDYSSAQIVRVKSRVTSSFDPRPYAPQVIAEGANKYSFDLSWSHAPGLYELRVPVTQNNWTTSPRTSVTKVVTQRFQLVATKKLSRATTRVSTPGWRIGRTATFNVNAPTYHRGAKATLYFKKQGTKKFKKIKTVKLKGKAVAYQSKAAIKTKKVQSSGVVQVRISKSKWAPAYKAKNLKIKVTRR